MSWPAPLWARLWACSPPRLFDRLGEVRSAFGPQQPALHGQRFVDFAHQMQQAAQVGLLNSQRAFDLLGRQKFGIEAKIEAQVIVIFLLERGPETRKRHPRWPQFPVVMMLPKIPGRLDFDAAIGLRKIARRGDQVRDKYTGVERAFQNRWL